MPSFRELNSPLGFTHRLCQTLRGCIHEPNNLALGVLRGFPHFSHRGPYFDKMWSHRTFGLVSRKPVILWYSCSATAYICSFGLPCGTNVRGRATRIPENHRLSCSATAYICSFGLPCGTNVRG